MPTPVPRTTEGYLSGVFALLLLHFFCPGLDVSIVCSCLVKCAVLVLILFIALFAPNLANANQTAPRKSTTRISPFNRQ